MQAFLNSFQETMDTLGIESFPARAHEISGVIKDFTTGIEEIVAKGGYSLLHKHLHAVEQSLSTVYVNSPADVSKKSTIARYVATLLMRAILTQTKNTTVVFKQHWVPVAYTRSWSHHEGEWKRNKMAIHQTTVLQPVSSSGNEDIVAVRANKMSRNALVHVSKKPKDGGFSQLIEDFFGAAESRFQQGEGPDIVNVVMMLMHSVRGRMSNGQFAVGNTVTVVTSMLRHLDSFNGLFVRTVRVKALRIPMNLSELPIYHSVSYGKVVVFPLNTRQVIIVSSKAPVHGQENMEYVAWFIGRVIKCSLKTGLPVAGLSVWETNRAVEVVASIRGNAL